MKSDDKQQSKIDRLALLTFEKYFGNKLGEGAWTMQHDEWQLAQIRKLVSLWHTTCPGHVDTSKALDLARGEGGIDRWYVGDVCRAYNLVVAEGITPAL